MKKSLLLGIVFLAALVSCNSQDMGRVKIGVFAGGQTTDAKYFIDGHKQPTTSKLGINAGIMVEIPWDNNLFFSPELLYSGKGYGVVYKNATLLPIQGAMDNSLRMSTIELAALVQYNMFHTDNYTIFVKMGPSLDFQMAGKETFHDKTGTKITRTVPVNFWTYGYFGASGTLVLGLERGKNILSTKYNLGIGNVANKDNGPHIFYNTFSVSVGRWF